MPQKTTPAKADLPIEVRASTIHGAGAFATRRLKAEEFIGRYTGRVYTAEQAAERDWEQAVTFVFGLGNGSVIDGAEGGNATRHINHSCSPNCAAYEVEAEDGEPQIHIHALRRINPGAELFLDYSLQVEPGGDEAFACACGSKVCRGTLVGVAPAA